MGRAFPRLTFSRAPSNRLGGGPLGYLSTLSLPSASPDPAVPCITRRTQRHFKTAISKKFLCTHLFSSSSKSASRFKCHFCACTNTCFKRRTFVWEEAMSSDSTSPADPIEQNVFFSPSLLLCCYGFVMVIIATFAHQKRLF